MKTLRLITAMVLVVGLIGVFSAFSAEQTKQGKKEGIITDTQESKDQKKAPNSIIQAPAAAVQTLPLTITRLYLKDGTVHVVIKKQGSKRLSDEDYKATKLKVEASTLIKPLEWTLLEVDPHKRLNQLIREKDFDTGLAVTDRVQVTATLYRGLWKTAKEGTLYLFKKAKKTEGKDLMLSERSQSAAAQSPGESVPTKRQAQQNLQMAQRIEIFSPSGGEVFDWGDTIRIRYRVDLREEAGDVTFTFETPSGHALATTTHFFEPLDLPEDLGGVELEPTGLGSEPATLPAEGSEPSTEEWGIGDRVFEWTLPSPSRIGFDVRGYGFRIVARRDTLFGASQKFTMLCSSTSCSSDPFASIEPRQAILRHGQTVNVLFAFCGYDGLDEIDNPVYICPVSLSGSENMGLWARPSYKIVEMSTDRVRGVVRVTVPRSLDPDEGPYMIALVGGPILYTSGFQVAEPMARSDLEMADLFRNQWGDIIARVAVSDDLGAVEVPIQVNDRILFATVGPRETDIVIGHVDPPATSSYCYEEWTVTVNPDGRIPEANRGNNSLTKRISYSFRDGFIEQYFDEPAITIWNCSAEPVAGVSSIVSARQRGIREDESGDTEEFDLEVPFTVEIAEDCPDGNPGHTTRGDDIPVGGCAIVRVDSDDLEGVFTTITFTFSFPYSTWIASGASITIGPFD